MLKRVSFLSNGSKIVGNLYRPEGNTEELPAIVLCHGFAGVKEMLLPAYANSFCDNGYIVLAFDYRGFGESEGESGRLDPSLQIEDIHNALDFIAKVEGVDASRIGLWGTSYGGANAVLVASQTDKINALCVQLTFGDGERVITGDMSNEEREKFEETLNKMRKKKEATGKELFMPIVKFLSDPQSKEFYVANAEKFEELNIKIPFLHLAETMKHKPEQAIDKVNVPVLVVGSQEDGVNPISETHSLFECAKEPKELLVIPGATHYEVYSGEYFEQAIKKELEFFDEYLK